MDLNDLPEDCIAKILSFTTPRDVCRLSSVKKLFRSASQSDAVWDGFLPPDLQTLVPQSLVCSSKKELYLALCDHPVLIDDGKKKRTGKKCYMLSARGIAIVWGGSPNYWRWLPFPDSRFPEVAELITVCWLYIDGNISTAMLSEDTVYAAYLVFKLTDNAFGWEYPMEVWFSVVGSGSRNEKIVCFNEETTLLQDRTEECRFPEVREDGWLEIKLGEFFNNGNEQNDILEMGLRETRHLDWKGGLVVHGIEIRPKSGR